MLTIKTRPKEEGVVQTVWDYFTSHCEVEPKSITLKTPCRADALWIANTSKGRFEVCAKIFREVKK